MNINTLSVANRSSALSSAVAKNYARPANNTMSMIPIQVIRREVLAADVVTLYFARPGTRQAPAAYLPGQFVTLVLPGHYDILYRSYSLCGAGDPREPWEITVKRVQQGVVSNYLFDTIQVGMVLQATPPRGSFVLPQMIRRDMQFVFVAAGSGITPIRGMLRALAALPPAQRPQVQLHYASRSPEAIIYRDELARLDPQRLWVKQWHYMTGTDGRMTPAMIFANAGSLPRSTHWYMCGPEALRQDLQTALERGGVAPTLIHSEVFADQSKRRPVRNNAGAGPTVARVAIQETGASIDVRAHETLLEALERHGYQPEFSCRSGSCGTCKLRVLGGRVEAPGNSALSANERAAGYVLSCVTQPRGDVLIQSGGRVPGRGNMQRPFAAARRASEKQSLRIATVALLGVALFGIWGGLTSHSPANLNLSLPSFSLPSDNSGGDNSGRVTIPAIRAHESRACLPIPTVKTGRHEPECAHIAQARRATGQVDGHHGEPASGRRAR